METQILLSDYANIVWQGKPNLKVWFAKADIFLIPFSVLWCFISFQWEISVIKFYIKKPDVIYMVLSVFGLAFCIIAIYLLIGRYYWKYRKKTSEQYIFNGNQILILANSKINHLDIKKALQIKLSDVSKSGTGTITIGENLAVATAYLNTGLDFLIKQKDILVMRDIPDAKEVAGMLRTAILHAEHTD